MDERERETGRSGPNDSVVRPTGSTPAGPANTPPFGSGGTAAGGGPIVTPAGTAAGMGSGSRSPDQQDTGEQVRDAAKRAQSEAADRVNDQMNRAAGGLETAAQKLDDFADRQTRGATGAKAKAGDMAHGTADTMESLARYLRDNEVEGLQRDLEQQIRENPLRTLLIGVAAGWVVGKILR